MRNKDLDASITIRLTTEEKIRLQNDAELAGLTISEIVRRRYFGRPIVAHMDEIAIRELRRQGGLLKDNFSVMRESGCSKDVQELQENTLKKIISVIDELAGNIKRR